MRVLLLLALMQAPTDSLRFTRVAEKPLNDTLNLSLSVASGENERRRLRVSLIDRRRPKQATLMTEVRDQYVEQYQIVRVDDSSVVISRMGFYQAMPYLKLFLDPQRKGVLKQIDFPPDISLKAVDDREVAAVLEVPQDIVQQLEQKPWKPGADSMLVPRELREHPLPHSTYGEFARARPERVADGYAEEGTFLEDEPGPFQVVGSRTWFGKTFYDGEGHTGVGGLGFFDTRTAQYTMLAIPELADWSVSALLIEEDAAWLGMVGYPEGETYSGGLLRYNFKSRKARIFPVQEVVYQIARSKDRLYVGTKNGAYQVKGTLLTRRYRVEPNIDNRFLLVTENIRAR